MKVLLPKKWTKTKSAQGGQLKTRPNQKVEENKPALESNVTLKYKWAGHNFWFGGLEGKNTEPYNVHVAAADVENF